MKKKILHQNLESEAIGSALEKMPRMTWELEEN